MSWQREHQLHESGVAQHCSSGQAPFSTLQVSFYQVKESNHQALQQQSCMQLLASIAPTGSSCSNAACHDAGAVAQITKRLNDSAPRHCLQWVKAHQGRAKLHKELGIWG